MINKRAKPDINAENIERALHFWASIIVDLDKPEYLPLMERLEKELQLYKAARDPIARARSILDDARIRCADLVRATGRGSSSSGL